MVSSRMTGTSDENTPPGCINVQGAPMVGKLIAGSVESEPKKPCEGIKRSIQEVGPDEADKNTEQVEGGGGTVVTATKRARIDAWLGKTYGFLFVGHAVLTASATACLERSKTVHLKHVQPWMKRLGHRICALPRHLCMRPLALLRAAPASAAVAISPEAEPACAEVPAASQASSSPPAPGRAVSARGGSRSEKTRKGVKRSIQEVEGDEADKHADEGEDGVVTQLTAMKRARIDVWVKKTSNMLSVGNNVLKASATAGLERSKAVHTKYVQPWVNRLGQTISALPEHICIRSLVQQHAAPTAVPMTIIPEAEPAEIEAATDSQALSSSCAETQVVQQPATAVEADGGTGVQEYCFATCDDMPAEAEINPRTDTAVRSAQLPASNGKHSRPIFFTGSASMAEWQTAPTEVSEEPTPALSDARSVNEPATVVARIEAADPGSFSTQEAAASWSEMLAEAEINTQTDVAAWSAELTLSKGESSLSNSSTDFAPMAENQATPEEVSVEVTRAYSDGAPVDKLETGMASFEAIDEVNFSAHVAREQAADPMSSISCTGATEYLPTMPAETQLAHQISNESSADGGAVAECGYAAEAATCAGEIPMEADLYARTEIAPWVPLSDAATKEVYYWNTQINETTWTLP